MKLSKTGLVKVKDGHKIHLGKVSTTDSGPYGSKEESLQRMEELQAQLSEFQERLYAENKRSVLIIFQAMDTGGKDGAVKSLMTGLNPTGVQVTSFKAPTWEELDHDYLWRVHQKVPSRGMIGVWNRSHYEDVLITRVHKMVDKKTCQARFEQINNFEKMLVENDVTLLKFFLHISKDEQKERLQARLDDPTKHWKFNEGDLKERALWDEYQVAYEDVLNQCSTKYAPWFIVPADKKWARNIIIAEAVLDAIAKLKPQFPQVELDPAKMVIE